MDQPDVHQGYTLDWLATAEFYSERGECEKRQVGCVIVRNDHVLGTGFNRRAIGTAGNCPGCPGLKDLAPCNTVHAEVAAIIDAKCELAGSTFYVSTKPCDKCKETAGLAGAHAIKWPTGELYYD